MNTAEELENSLSSMEKLLNLKITIIDNEGILHPLDRSVFSEYRISHKKNAVCRLGFSPDCVRNCRFRMNRICDDKNRPFPSVCWKNIRQIVVPLSDGRVRFGMLYAGVWKCAGRPPRGLPPSFYRAWNRMPVWNAETGEHLMSALSVFADGLGSILRREELIRPGADLRRFRILDYIDGHLEKSFGLPDLAENLSLSVPYSSVLVKELFGCTFSKLVRKRRIRAVKRLLSGTDFSLDKISTLCGFSSKAHLGKTFKEEENIPPGKFREKNQSFPDSGFANPENSTQ